MKLNQLKPKDKAVIEKIDLPEEIQRRLFALGIFCGAVIQMQRSAPLRDPQEFIVSGNLIAIRRSYSQWITVSKVPE